MPSRVAVPAVQSVAVVELPRPDVHRPVASTPSSRAQSAFDEATAETSNPPPGRPRPKRTHPDALLSHRHRAKLLGEHWTSGNVPFSQSSPLARTVPCLRRPLRAGLDPQENWPRGPHRQRQILAPKPHDVFPGGRARGGAVARRHASWTSAMRKASSTPTPKMRDESGTPNQPGSRVGTRSCLAPPKTCGHQGRLRAELASLKQTPVLLFWHYVSGGAKTGRSCCGPAAIAGGRLSKAYLDTARGAFE